MLRRRCLSATVLMLALLNAHLHCLASEIAEVVVVSTRDSTGLVSVIKPADRVDPNLLPSSLITTADIISSLPGVSRNGQGGSLQAYTIRGFSRARIQTRLAGVLLATERRAGNAASLLDPFLIGQIEVVKGPASTLYGSGALGGVVSIDEKNFRGASLVASAYTQGQQGMLGAGWGNNSVSVGVAYRKHQRSEDTSGRELNDKMERASATFSWTDNILKDYVTREKIIAARGRDVGKSSDDFPVQRITHYPLESHLLGGWTLTRDKAWSLDFYGHRQKLETTVYRPGQVLSESTSTSLDYGASWIRLWQEGGLNYRLGLEWNRRDKVRISESVIQDQLVESFISLSGDQDTRALFTDGQWNVNGFTLHLGARFTTIKQRGDKGWNSDNQVTSNMLLKFEPNTKLEFYAELGSGFRFPELTEKFFNGITGRGTIVSPAILKPERSISGELGFVMHLDKFRIQGSVYATDIDNYIERITIAERILSFRNVKNGAIHGIELSANYQWSNWTVHANGHWLNGEDDDNQPLADGIPARIVFNVAYQKAWGSIGLDYRYRFSTDRVHLDELPVEQFNRLSLSLLYHLDDEREIRFWLDNLLNDDFRLTPDNLSPVSSGRGAGITFLWQH